MNAAVVERLVRLDLLYGISALALLATLIAFSGNGRAQAQPVLD